MDSKQSTATGESVDVRCALEWAFSEAGDPDIAVDLTKAARPLWRHLMLSNASLGTRGSFHSKLSLEVGSALRSSIGLYAILASRQLLAGESAGRLKVAWQNAFVIARKQTEVERDFWALWACWLENYPTGQHRVSLAYAKQARELVAGPAYPLETACANSFTAVSEFALGHFEAAREHLAHAIGFAHLPIKPFVLIPFQWDPFVAMRCYYADALWHLGDLDTALAVVKENFEIARDLNHPASLWCALAHGGCAIAIRWGDMDTAWRFSECLQVVSRFNPPWGAWARCLQGWLTIRSGDLVSGLPALQAALAELEASAYGHRYPGFLAVLAEALSANGQDQEGRSTIDQAIDWARQHSALWCRAELLRVRGDVRRACNEAEAAAADFTAALEIAGEQGALVLRLRAATSLARLRVAQGKLTEARALIEPVCAQFPQRCQAEDVRSVRSVLASTLRETAPEVGYDVPSRHRPHGQGKPR